MGRRNGGESDWKQHKGSRGRRGPPNHAQTDRAQPKAPKREQSCAEALQLNQRLNEVQSLDNVQLLHSQPPGDLPHGPPEVQGAPAGLPVTVTANWHQLDSTQLVKVLYHYTVQARFYRSDGNLSSDVTGSAPTDELLQVFQRALYKLLDDNGTQAVDHVAYDGRSDAFAPYQLQLGGCSLGPNNEMVFHSTDVSRLETGRCSWRVSIAATTGCVINVDRARPNEPAMGALAIALQMYARQASLHGKRLVTTAGAVYPPALKDVLPEVQLLNSYDRTASFKVGVKGYFHSLSKSRSSSVINLVNDMALSAFVAVSTMSDAIAGVLGYTNARALDNAMSEGSEYFDNRMQRRGQVLKGVRMTASYHVDHQGNAFSRTRTCQGIGKPSSAERILEGDYRGHTIEEYFKLRYNVRVQYSHMPTIVCGKAKSGGDILIPAEHLQINNGQKISNLSSHEMDGLIRQASLPPSKRVKQSLYSSLNSDGHNSIVETINNSPAAQSFGVHFSPSMLQVQARVLPQPLLQYGKGQQVTPGTLQFKGAWNARGYEVVHQGSGKIKAINLSGGEESYLYTNDEVQACMDKMARLARDKGVRYIQFPGPNEVLSASEKNVESIMMQAKKDLESSCAHSEGKLMLIFLDVCH